MTFLPSFFCFFPNAIVIIVGEPWPNKSIIRQSKWGLSLSVTISFYLGISREYWVTAGYDRGIQLSGQAHSVWLIKSRLLHSRIFVSSVLPIPLSIEVLSMSERENGREAVIKLKDYTTCGSHLWNYSINVQFIYFQVPFCCMKISFHCFVSLWLLLQTDLSIIFTLHKRM